MIDLGRWQEIKHLVQTTLDRPPEERDEFLTEACEGDRELQASVEALLQVSETNAHLFDDLHFIPEPVREAALAPGDMVGAYTVVRPLGTGGMSSVYLADDPEHERHVALKVLPPRLLRLSPREHTILAQLNHPNIATLYSSGITSAGFRYLAMEHVEGLPLTRYCTDRELTLEGRLRLFMKVSDAVAYAHAKTIVHRDLTPNNILVTEEGEPKLLDFGIAKELPASGEAATLTEIEHRPLTLSFASPEQLSGEETGTASDIYSLGVLLCVLVTGRLPYKVKSPHDLPWAIRNQNPERPSDLLGAGPHEPLCEPPAGVQPRRLQGDLDAIVERALRKEPDQRYTSIADLAADIRRHLSHEPVLARHGSWRYRTSRFVRRHAPGVTVAVLVTIAMIGLMIGLVYQQQLATSERSRAMEEAQESQHLADFLESIFDEADPQRNPESAAAVRVLLKTAEQELPESLSDQPLRQSRFLTVLSRIYRNLGLPQKAEELLQRGLELKVDSLGPDHPDLAWNYNELGVINSQLGRYDKAKEYYKTTVRLERSKEEPDEGKIATVLNNLGVLGRRAGHYDEAEADLQEALRIRREIFEGDHRRIASTLQNLGVLMEDRGNYEAAETYYLESLAMNRRLYGDDHPTVASGQFNLAEAARHRGDIKKQLTFLRNALSTQARILGENHPDSLKTRRTLAIVQAETGDVIGAISEITQVLEAQKEVLGVEHPEVAQTLVHLARLETRQGNYKKASKHFAEAEGILVQTFGQDSPKYAWYFTALAAYHWQQGELVKAEESYRQVLKLQERTKGKGSRSTLVPLLNLSRLAVDQRDYEHGKALLDTAAEIAERELSAEHPLWAGVLENRALLALDRGDPESATILARDAVALTNAAYPRTHWAVALAQVVLAECLAAGGENEQAQELLTVHLETLLTFKGDRAPSSQRGLRTALLVFKAQGKLGEAAKYRELLDSKPVN